LEWDDDVATVVFDRAFPVAKSDRLYLFSCGIILILPAARFHESGRSWVSAMPRALQSRDCV
jgi:hypothetical protein